VEPTLSNLKSITDTLLADNSSYLQIRNACTELLDLFCRISCFDETDEVNNKHMQTAAGVAVSPQSAAVCIRDFMRTRIFMRGLKKAISAKLQEEPHKAVTVLYAGTGPFATLLIPLVSFFDATQLKMQLLEINPASIVYLNSLISYFKLEPYLLQLTQTDAVTYQVPEDMQPDIILSETMMPALKKEPQVSIMANLVAQCPDAWMIPETINITVGLWSSKLDHEKRVIPLQTILDFNKTTALQLAAAQKNHDKVFPLTSVQVEQPPERYWSRLALITYIRVFNDEALHYNQSSLNIPELAYNLHTVKNWPAIFNFQYHIEPVPGFKISLDADNHT
jgi:predicted RNA methylase